MFIVFTAPLLLRKNYLIKNTTHNNISTNPTLQQEMVTDDKTSAYISHDGERQERAAVWFLKGLI